MSAESWLGAPARLYAATRFLLRPLDFYTEQARRRGRVFRVGFPGFPPALVITEATLAREVLADSETFHAGGANALVFGLLDGAHSVITTDGDEHRFLRRILGPLAGWGRRHQHLVDELFAQATSEWPDSAVIEARGSFAPVVLDITLRCIVGRSSAEAPELAAAVGTLAKRSHPLLGAPFLRRDLGPASPGRRFVRAQERLDELLERLVPPAPKADCALALLAAAQSRAEDQWREEHLRDQLVTLLLAGSETAPSAIGWAFEYLVAHPDVMERAAAEIDAGTGEEFLDAVVRESLRLRPPNVQVWRMVTRPTVLDGHALAPGNLVIVAIAAIHAGEGSLADQPGFQPEPYKNGSSHDLLSFGGGRRTCLGSHLARQMVRSALRAALTEGRLTPVSSRRERPRIHGPTIGPAKGGRFRFARHYASG